MPEKLPRGQQLPDIASKAERDPGAAFRALMADPLLQTADNARALFLVLGKNDPAEGFTLLSQIPAVPWKRDAIRGLATGWTQRDPSAAAAAGLALPTGVPRADFLAATFAQWILQDITAATTWVSSLPPQESRSAIISKLEAFEVQVRNAEEMAALLALAPDISSGNSVLNNPFYRWAESTPEAALEWVLTLPPDEEGEIYASQFLSLALRQLASDPARVLPLLQQLKDPTARESLVSSAGAAWAGRDPAAAWTWAEQLTDPDLRESFEASLASEWARLDADTAIPWLWKNKTSAIGNLDSENLRVWASASPETALEMIRNFPPDLSSNEVAGGLMAGIAETKPMETLSHLDLIKESDHRAYVISRSLARWSRSDITAASAYTDALPPGKDRQSAIKGILGAAFEQEPESALTWAVTLENPERKNEEISRYFQKWQKTDPSAAHAWLSGAALDDDLRHKLASFPPQGGGTGGNE